MTALDAGRVHMDAPVDDNVHVLMVLDAQGTPQWGRRLVTYHSPAIALGERLITVLDRPIDDNPSSTPVGSAFWFAP
jgi:hypothetical protein